MPARRLMPKLFVYSTEGTFDATGRAAVASELTELGMECEKLAKNDQVRAGVWVAFSEYSADAVFRGGALAPSATIVLQVFALEGGLDSVSKSRLIAEGTRVLQTHAKSADVIPTYVVISERPEADWGMLGKQVHLAALRDPA
jgi:phenylpyruvate tautomerase PptA (4-oxalocrotonate tautomerase family)